MFNLPSCLTQIKIYTPTFKKLKESNGLNFCFNNDWSDNYQTQLLLNERTHHCSSKHHENPEELRLMGNLKIDSVCDTAERSKTREDDVEGDGLFESSRINCQHPEAATVRRFDREEASEEITTTLSVWCLCLCQCDADEDAASSSSSSSVCVYRRRWRRRWFLFWSESVSAPAADPVSVRPPDTQLFPWRCHHANWTCCLLTRLPHQTDKLSSLVPVSQKLTQETAANVRLKHLQREERDEAELTTKTTNPFNKVSISVQVLLYN